VNCLLVAITTSPSDLSKGADRVPHLYSETASSHPISNRCRLAIVANKYLPMTQNGATDGSPQLSTRCG